MVCCNSSVDFLFSSFFYCCITCSSEQKVTQPDNKEEQKSIIIKLICITLFPTINGELRALCIKKHTHTNIKIMDAGLNTFQCFLLLCTPTPFLPALNFEVDLRKARIGVSNVMNLKCMPQNKTKKNRCNTEFEALWNTIKSKVQSRH